MFGEILFHIAFFIKKHIKFFRFFLYGIVVFIILTFISGKIYQNYDNRIDRGAIAVQNSVFGDKFSSFKYLEQGWDPSDSLWFYNTTQGSDLIPYDFFLVLKQANSDELFRSNANMDKLRYLTQQKSFFNPDALPVGITKDSYAGKDYVGYTCAACHTSQVNYNGVAIRIDGGPAMADMTGFLLGLEKALHVVTPVESKHNILASKEAQYNAAKSDEFIQAVIALNNDYDDKKEVVEDLKKWTNFVSHYNNINHSELDYGYARLDAFGRIYNRVLQHVLNKSQVKDVLSNLLNIDGSWLLSADQIEQVLKGTNETVFQKDQFEKVIKRLQYRYDGYPGLNAGQIQIVKKAIFNEPNAPVSYPYLWDIAQSDYVQWNALASNAGLGPLGRNAGEVTGVFATLDWTVKKGFKLSSFLSTLLTGQKDKSHQIVFTSSIDLTNLQRLEQHLHQLMSPKWPGEILGQINDDKKKKGRLIYKSYCQSCHEDIDREDSARKVIAKISNINIIGTDHKTAINSVSYKGKSGNIKHTYQKLEVGSILMEEDAPVKDILTAVVTGAVATPDPDKWPIRRFADWIYTLGMSFATNKIKASIKRGNYEVDTTANPYNSLLSYKARPLNGIWATAPYLHNGSVPSLHHLLLPYRADCQVYDDDCRPNTFVVGSREFIPEYVGFASQGYDGFKFDTSKYGNHNTGHNFGNVDSQWNDKTNGFGLPALTKEQRSDLLEYLKSI
ncbi:MAG: ribonuclease E [Alcanivoracaceae bacterium]|nr:ribonuclease E [Alcanivoracaceae bacterium]